jgi:hypothetical protein
MMIQSTTMKDLTNKKTMGSRAWIAVAVLAAATAALPAAHAIELTLQPASTSVAPGAGVDVSLVISGLGTGGAPSLGGFDLNLSFDPGVLTYGSVTFGDPLLGNQLGLGFPSVDAESADTGLGLLNLFSVSLDSVADLEDLQADSFVLASVHFTALGNGLSALTFSDVLLTDALGDTLSLDAIRGGSVRVGVSTVPDGGLSYPGTFLMAFGAGCAWVRQRRNRSSEGLVG